MGDQFFPSLSLSLSLPSEKITKGKKERGSQPSNGVISWPKRGRDRNKVLRMFAMVSVCVCVCVRSYYTLLRDPTTSFEYLIPAPSVVIVYLSSSCCVCSVFRGIKSAILLSYSLSLAPPRLIIKVGRATLEKKAELACFRGCPGREGLFRGFTGN